MGCTNAKKTAYPSPRERPEEAVSDPKPLDAADSNTKVIAKRGAYHVGLEAGRTVYYCTCGRSANQPYCDGKHKGTPFNPLPHIPEKSVQAYFCGCKATKKAPFCDGSHQNLKW